ncbi:hypothetical protein [Flavobacterium sp. ALD4]|uniref:hypothetical protein n=1 Tax=Flavobacterium sp. ALD4 TaxID=2058314 RepID=UPI003518FEC9
MPKSVQCLLILILCLGRITEKTEPRPTSSEANYFPPLTGTRWETNSFASLNWNQSAVQSLLDYLELKNSKSFIILINGRIVMENYFNGHSATTN